MRPRTGPKAGIDLIARRVVAPSAPIGVTIDGMTIAPRRQPGKTPQRDLDARFVGLLGEARSLQPRTVSLRRSVHRHPEQGLALPATQASVLRALEGLPLRVSTGQALGSVVAVLDGERPGPAVLLRGDMDALPITERTGLAFASENPGTMHACGHDTHVAMLASAARLLAGRRDALAGQVVFMFQPGEEGHHGAEQMLAEGLLRVAAKPIQRALALHMTANVRSGALATRPGPMMASSDSFTVLVTGKGGHGALPHRAIDPVPPAAAMVGALQTMLGRRVEATEPAVLTVGRITAGTTTNIIPETAELAGTIRALSEPTRKLLHEELRTVCEHVGAAHGCRVDVHDPSRLRGHRERRRSRPARAATGRRRLRCRARREDVDADDGRGGLRLRAATRTRSAGLPRCLPARRQSGRRRTESLRSGGVRRVGDGVRRRVLCGVRTRRVALAADYVALNGSRPTARRHAQ